MADQATPTSESGIQTIRQRTLAGEVVVQGKGLMLGQDATLRMLPAQADHGIVFERVDLDPPVLIPVTIEYAIERRSANCCWSRRGSGRDDRALHVGPAWRWR